MALIECGAVPLSRPYEAGCYSDLGWMLDIDLIGLDYPCWLMTLSWGAEPKGYAPPASGYESWRTPEEIEAATMAILGFGPEDEIPF